MLSPIASLVVSGVALVVALFALWYALRLRVYSQAAWVKNRFTELEGVIEAHGEWWKKLNANVASIRGAMKRKDSDESHVSNGSGTSDFGMKPGETPEQWKARMRAALATGSIRPPNR